MPASRIRNSRPPASRPLALPGAIFAAAGSVFLASACLPQVAKIYTERSAAERRSILRKHPTAWLVHNGMFGLGTAMMPVGAGLLAGRLDGAARAWAAVSGTLYGAAAVSWAPGLVHRVTEPDEFADKRAEHASFTGFTVLSAAALAALGAALHIAGHPWLGRLNVGSAAALSVTYAAVKDMPPFAWFSAAIATGVTLLRRDR